MNKRIKELERQAIEYANQQNTFDPRSEFNKKFAELIVKECLDKVNEAVYAREMSGRYYPDSDGKKILKYFGVEE